MGTHAEPTISRKASEYVLKEATRVEGTRLELGSVPKCRNSRADWDSIRDAAKSGQFDSIPSDVYVRCYSSLRKIASDHLTPVPMQRQCVCYWGPTGTGKSRRAWDEAGWEAYPKDPRTKFWDGYRGQSHVVFDEFRGSIDIAHLLRWTDRYPVTIEVKGSSTILAATHIWFTSNLHPNDWYPDLDAETKLALLRRLEIINII